MQCLNSVSYSKK